MYLTDKQKVKRLADMIEAMPSTGEFVVLFEKGEVQNLQGDRVLSFGVTLFDKVHQVEIVEHEDFDSSLEAIEPKNDYKLPFHNETIKGLDSLTIEKH